MKCREDDSEDAEAFLDVEARIDVRKVDRNILEQKIIAVFLHADIIFLVLEDDFGGNQFVTVHSPKLEDVDGEMRILLKV